MSADSGPDPHDNARPAADGSPPSGPDREPLHMAEQGATAHLEQEADDPFPTNMDVSQMPTQPLPETGDDKNITDVSNVPTQPLYSQVADTIEAPIPQLERTEVAPGTDVADIPTRELPDHQGDFYSAVTEPDGPPVVPPPSAHERDVPRDPAGPDDDLRPA